MQTGSLLGRSPEPGAYWSMERRVRSAVVGCALMAGVTGVVCLSAHAIAQTPSFTLLGIAPPRTTSYGTAVSDDGSVVAGYSDGLGQPGFRWTRQGGRNDFGVGRPTPSPAFGISGDGNFVVGTDNLLSASAYRWSQATGYQDISPASIAISEAYDASFDGSVVVGMARAGATSDRRPFRWSATSGFQVLSQDVNGIANGVSRDGNVVVGETNLPDRAFFWTPTGGMQFLPSLNGSLTGGIARAVNFDGSIIVGFSPSVAGPGRATMWVNGVPQQLPTTANAAFVPSGLSDDGSIVCGIINAGNGNVFPGVWTLTTGVIPLADYLTANGVVLPAGRTLGNREISMSSDGLTFVGDSLSAESNQAFIATIPSPGTFVVAAMGVVFGGRRRREGSVSAARGVVGRAGH